MAFIIRRFDVCMFAGLLLWLGIFHTLEQGTETPFWTAYGSALLVYGGVMLPALLFAWFRENIRAWVSPRMYWICRLVCFGVLVPVTTAVMIVLRLPGFDSAVLVNCAMLTLLLEIILFVAAFFRNLAGEVSWLRHFNLDKAILATITLVSLLLAVMAASSYGNPRYHNNGRLLIGGEFSLGKIIRHFDIFLAVFSQMLLMYCCGYLFFYFNKTVLVKKVMREKGIPAYILSVLAMIALLYPLLAQLLLWLPINRLMGNIFADNPFSLENAFAALSIIFLSLPLVLALQWSGQNNRIVSLEKEKAQTELALLRQQLNPHFFFNTLNNLYAMSLQRSGQTPESILQLSELMRYVIYKGQEERVHVQEEVKYLEDYMQLQMIRLKEPPVLRFDKDIAADAMMVPPMLLIVLVENAFKHGVEPAEQQAHLHMQLVCGKDGLYFLCENSFETPGTRGGIGLANLLKRLALLFPGRHKLTTSAKNHTFKAELQLSAL